MTYNIEVRDNFHVEEPVIEALISAAEATLLFKHAASGASLSILLTDDDSIRDLNRQFRGFDNPTDVLSFPIGDPIPGVEELKSYLGDIAISIPTANRQTKLKNHSLTEELQLLTIHGVLHLLGFDHGNPDQKNEMWLNQQQVLAILGLGDIQPTEDEHDS